MEVMIRVRVRVTIGVRVRVRVRIGATQNLIFDIELIISFVQVP
jgi:hypothetical protein